MKVYKRHKANDKQKFIEEVKYSLDYHFYDLWYDHYYDLWYDDCWDEYDSDCEDEDIRWDHYNRKECGMDWYYENREIFERNRTINEILDIYDDDSIPFNALNF